MGRTLETSQDPRFKGLLHHMDDMFVTVETSQHPMSWLKKDTPSIIPDLPIYIRDPLQIPRCNV
jgi:hypothetical protein